ncbi:activated protein kinase catalytic subunit alpha-1 [Seminavis robusta]|uniref:non-specific serine/threonine protein kinase n=1 Tax=Seminavis robusta TaxID=568900 RepID=A0A9N8DKR3_9STRA|nr:activated protein kinase catalytic subunit alpha-1 [Seminavis robusta]|eukprot:Sro198_g084080.1 activated protein kinase catalytic subunit alpha-1 (567) ;mRNA; r:46467-48277
MVRYIFNPTGRRATPARNKTFKFSAKLFVPEHTRDGSGKSLDELYSIDFENDVIEEGSKSVIYRCVHKESGEERAVKIVAKSSSNEDENARIRQEIELLKKMDHPNIVRVFSTFEDNKHFCIVMEYCKCGELRHQIIGGTSLSEFYVAVMIKTILSTINYCYQKHQVVHLGLKPENILLDSTVSVEQLKLIDFGNSIQAPTATKAERLIGSAAYLAPESLQYHSYSHKTDIWAIGCVAFLALSGHMPFDAANDKETLELIINSKNEVERKEIFQGDKWALVSDDAIDFLSKMLSFEPFKRPSAKEALQHPWIQRVTQAQIEVVQKRDISLAKSAIDNLFSLQAPSKLQQAALTYIASQCLSKFDKSEMERIYQALDLNGLGKLSKEDVQKAHAKYMEDEADIKKLTKGELKELFAQVDFLGNGFIEYSEFLVGALPVDRLLTEENMLKAFQHFDHDKDGEISAEDLKHVLGALLPKADTTSLNLDKYIHEKVLRQVETGAEGTITYDVFVDLLLESKSGPGRNPHRRQSAQFTSEEFRMANAVDRMSISGNVFDQSRFVFERNLKV